MIEMIKLKYHLNLPFILSTTSQYYVGIETVFKVKGPGFQGLEKARYFA